MAMRTLFGIFAMALAAGLPLPAHADIERHSGTVAGVDRATGTLLLDEVGPWRATASGTVVTVRLQIALAPSTPVVAVARAADATSSGWDGGFVERPAGLDALRQGEFVTVTVRREGRRLTAEQVTVATPSP